MSTTTWPAPMLRSPLQALLAFLRDALSHATPSLIAVAFLLGLARGGTSVICGWLQSGSAAEYWFRLLTAQAAAFCMLFAVLIAEQRVRSGTRMVPAYALPLLLAAAVAGVLSLWCVPGPCQPGSSYCSSLGQLAGWRPTLFFGADALARGGLAALVYANREQMLRSLRELGAAQVKRAEVRRNLVRTQLLTLQTMVDPASLFATLERTQRLYETNPTRADATLDQLIDQLRLATQRAQA